jgi:nucleoside-diphosphate-sugar epimerase
MTPTVNKPTLLLTGGSGVLGRALVDELVAHFDVRCLQHRSPVADPRVAGVEGNLRLPGLGLERDAFLGLAREVDVVLHSAAMTNWRAGREDIMATNLSGTVNLLDLAAQASARFYYVSTAFVARAAESATETRFVGANAYLESKVAAEQAVRDSGVPGAIVRPSVVIGDSRDGRMSAFQGFTTAAGAIVQGMAPVLPADADSLVDTVPQDVAARAILALIRNGVTSGEYWLTAGDQALSVNDVVDTCVEFAGRLGQTPHRPRLVPIEAVDRLLLPLLEGAIPAHLRRRFSELAELMLYFQNPTRLPSSLPELGLQEQVTHAALIRTVARILEYWAVHKGLLQPTPEPAPELVA